MSLDFLSDEEILNNKGNRWRKFCLNPDIWELEKKVNIDLINQWKEVEFCKENQDSIPSKQGIYMFIARPIKNTPVHVAHSYILYIGQTENLNQRFNSYFSYKNTTEPSDQLKRMMILIWERYLFFNYITNDYDKEKLTNLEYDLIDTVVPPINNRFRSRILKTHINILAER